MPFDRRARAPMAMGLGGLAVVVVAAGLVGARGRLAPANVALVLAVVVLATAFAGGRLAGALAGLLAATAFDFFYTRPYGELKAGRPNGLITALVLVVAGLVVGQAAERARQVKARLKTDQRNLRRMHRVVTVAASGEEDERDLVLTVTAELLDALELEACTFERPPFTSDRPRLQRDGTLAGRSGAVFAHGGFELPSGGVELPVVSRREAIGRFVLVPAPGTRVSAEQLLVAVALAHELGLAFAASARS
ncbi:MAG: DUF4118 domain-containing protein [Acidimicrobiales bacterium]